ncbi:MAG: YceD family protein [Sphingomonas adhaesiva]|uniref:YceD family protein n=1 Tax=Sphingomonas adhaesiva TaxID=28212 RepID=UPI002FF52CA9
MNAPEFMRVERLDTIGEEERSVAIAADQAERAALATRFGLVSVDRLEATFAIRRTAAGISATGMVHGEVVQACGVTGDPLPARVEEPVALLFVESSGTGEEVELNEGELDTIEIEGGGIDLGEAAAETLALALDPFPRSPRAAERLKEAGVLSEDEAGPFGALAGLKAKLEGKD